MKPSSPFLVACLLSLRNLNWRLQREERPSDCMVYFFDPQYEKPITQSPVSNSFDYFDEYQG